MIVQILVEFKDWQWLVYRRFWDFSFEVVTSKSNGKGPSINNVVSKSAFFDPLPPLVVFLLHRVYVLEPLKDTHFQKKVLYPLLKVLNGSKFILD